MLEALNAPAHIAEVTLVVRDADDVARFYADLLGLARRPDDRGGIALSAGEDGPTLLRLVARPDLPPASSRSPGLFHIAFLLPSRADLAAWTAHAQALGADLEGASDHLVSEAIYLSDPEGNGIEVYVDRPRESWPRDGEGVAMATLPLDGPGLMAELPRAAPPWRFPAAGLIGHVHLKVGDLAQAEAFYRDRLGMQAMARYPGAVFMSWGGYHHHIALNVWRSRGAPPRPPEAMGLGEVVIAGRSGDALADPAGNRLSFRP